jgi:hypothetical protein
MQLPSFDDMLKLAESQPEALETLRQQLVESTIQSAPAAYQRRLRGLQFTIDAERQVAANPMASCIRLSKLMHDRLYDLQRYIDPTSRPSIEHGELACGADILPFQGR